MLTKEQIDDIRQYLVQETSLNDYDAKSICDMAEKHRQACEQAPFGEVTKYGVVWANQNPHAYPIGTKFYAELPLPPEEK